MKKWDVIDVCVVNEIASVDGITSALEESFAIVIADVILMDAVGVISGNVLEIIAADAIILSLLGCFGWLEIWQGVADVIG